MIKKISLGAAMALFVLFGNFSTATAQAAATDVEVLQSKPDQEDPKSKKKKKSKANKGSCCSKSAAKSCSKGEKKEK